MQKKIWQNLTSIMIKKKNSSKWLSDYVHFNIIMAIYDKPIANITLKGEKLKWKLFL